MCARLAVRRVARRARAIASAHDRIVEAARPLLEQAPAEGAADEEQPEYQ
jgi:hypothetical protein